MLRILRHVDGQAVSVTPTRCIRPAGSLTGGLRALLLAWLIQSALPRDALAGGAWTDLGFVQNSVVNRFYVFPGPVYFAVTQYGRLHRSADARNWTPVFQFPGSGAVGTSAMVADGGTLLTGFAGQPGQAPLILSRDGGISWSPTGLSNVEFLTRLPDGGVLAWNEDGFHRAEGPDYRWSPVPARWEGAEAPPYNVSFFDGRVLDGRMVGLPIFQLVPSSNQYQRQVWLAPLEGRLDTLFWTRIRDSLPANTIPWDTTILATSPEGLLRSEDDGRTWQLQAGPGPDFIQETGGLLVGIFGTKWMETRRVGFSRDGGKSWQGIAAFDSLGAMDLILRGDTAFAAVGRDGVLEARPGGTRPVPAGRGMRKDPAVRIALHGGTVFAHSGFHLGSLRAGSSEWIKFLPNQIPDMHNMAASGRYLYGCGRRLMRTADLGPIASWDTLGTSSCDAIAHGGGKAAAIRALPSGIYDATQILTRIGSTGTLEDIILGTLIELGRFRALAVQGDTTVAAFNRLHVSTQAGGPVSVKGTMDSTVHLAFHGGELYRVRRDAVRCHPFCLDLSSDLGETWTSREGKPPASFHLSLASSRLGLAAATDSGVFLSPDRGASWYPLGDWQLGEQAHGIEAAGDQVLVGHQDGGVRSLDLRTVALSPRERGSRQSSATRFRSAFRYRGIWTLADGRALPEGFDPIRSRPWHRNPD